MPTVTRHELYYHVARAPSMQKIQLSGRTREMVVGGIQIHVEVQVPVRLVLGFHHGAARLLTRIDNLEAPRAPHPDGGLARWRTRSLSLAGPLRPGGSFNRGC